MLYESYINQPPMWLIVLFFIAILWEMIWKGLGLWTAGKNKQKEWFIFIFVFNSLGIIPIIYLLFYKKKDDEKDLAHFAKAQEEQLKAQLLRTPTRKRIPKKQTTNQK